MNGKFRFTLEVAESEVEVWWPNEYGKQTTYFLELEYPNSRLVKQVGFRYSISHDFPPPKGHNKTIIELFAS